jgi:hypothetical protein
MSDPAERTNVTGWGAILPIGARVSDPAERTNVTGWGAILRMGPQ